MSWRKDFQLSDWPFELSPRMKVEPRIVGIRSTFRGSTFFRLAEIRPNCFSVAGEYTVRGLYLFTVDFGSINFCYISSKWQYL